MKIDCYGWIPIFTSYLLADNLHLDISKAFPRECSDTDDTQEIDGSLEFGGNNYLTSIHLDIPEIASVKIPCNIERTGLVYFSFDEIKFSEDPIDNIIFNKKTLPNWIFDLIRDLYHDHVHHGKDSDCKLSPVIATTKEEAINKILHQYQNKIVEYHKEFNTIKPSFFLSPIRLFKLISKKQMDILTTGCGEFTYAQSFVNLHNDEIKSLGLDADIINKSFKLADNSVSTLKDKMSWTIMYRISYAAFIIAIFATLLAIDATYKIFFVKSDISSVVEASVSPKN